MQTFPNPASHDLSKLPILPQMHIGIPHSMTRSIFNESLYQGPEISDEEAKGVGEKLNKAMEGKGTDEKEIIEALYKYNPNQRGKIASMYMTTYRKPLREHLKSELSGDFRKLCLALADFSLSRYEVDLLFEAMAGAGTNDDMLIEILVGRTNVEFQAIKDKYLEVYNKDLDKVIGKELSGDMAKFFELMMKGMRDEAGTKKVYNDEKVAKDVEKLFKCGVGKKMGTNEEKFFKVLLKRPHWHLIRVFEEYLKKHDMSIERVIIKEFAGKAEKSLLALVSQIKNRSFHIAHAFQSAMRGMGTNDDKLVRLVTRYSHPNIMESIKDAYKLIYGITLADAVHSETTGDYCKLLFAIIKNRI